MKERWLPVVGYEGHYEVSDQGRVKSLARVVMRSNGKEQSIRERILRPGMKPCGHVSVRLSGVSYLVHTLVLTTFKGKRPDNNIGLHKNHKPADNRLTNLKWGTHTENLVMDYAASNRSRAKKITANMPSGACFEFLNGADAARFLEVDKSTIHLALKNGNALRKSGAYIFHTEGNDHEQ